MDDVVGVVHIKDIIGNDSDDAVDLRTIARSVMSIPENVLIGALLQEFRQSKQHFAFVQDEHGTILGIVTLEDVLEELVGNIQDEFDLEEPNIVQQTDGRYLIDGDILVDELNQSLALSLATEEADTLSGLIVERFGHKVQTGKKLKYEEVMEIEIIETNGIRITKVMITLLTPDQ